MKVPRRPPPDQPKRSFNLQPSPLPAILRSASSPLTAHRKTLQLATNSCSFAVRSVTNPVNSSLKFTFRPLKSLPGRSARQIVNGHGIAHLENDPCSASLVKHHLVWQVERIIDPRGVGIGPHSPIRSRSPVRTGSVATAGQGTTPLGVTPSLQHLNMESVSRQFIRTGFPALSGNAIRQPPAYCFTQVALEVSQVLSMPVNKTPGGLGFWRVILYRNASLHLWISA